MWIQDLFPTGIGWRAQRFRLHGAGYANAIFAATAGDESHLLMSRREFSDLNLGDKRA